MVKVIEKAKQFSAADAFAGQYRLQHLKRAAAKLLAGARPTEENKFKLPLAERALAAVLAEAKG